MKAMTHISNPLIPIKSKCFAKIGNECKKAEFLDINVLYKYRILQSFSDTSQIVTPAKLKSTNHYIT